MIAAGCGSNYLEPNPVPRDEQSRPLPSWYPEKPWSANAGDSRIYIQGKIVFANDSAVIRPGSEKVLEKLLMFTKEHPEVSRLRIEGHTDSNADDDYNLELSAKRALAVCDWLVDHGVDHLRLMAVGYGESRPIAPNETPVGRSENRRTEFHVAEIDGRPFGVQTALKGGMVLEVLSLEERRKREQLATPKPAPKPKHFTPTGDEIKPAAQPPKKKPTDES